MQSYTKFFVQRHLFERLVSAYVNKFEDPPQSLYMGLFGNKITYNHLQNYPTNRATFNRDFQHFYLQLNKPTNKPLYFEPYPRISTHDKRNNYFTRLSQSLRQKAYELYRDDFSYSNMSPGSESFACEGLTI